MEDNTTNAELSATETTESQETSKNDKEKLDVILSDASLAGKTCPFCKTDIKEGEEIIVCPACNTPHHKGCWEENKGCTTFGCSEQHYEEQHTNPTDACANCGAPLGDGQAFCPKCGTAKPGKKQNVCSKCGAELKEDQEFCPKCGQKAGLEIDTNVTSAISQFNAGLDKKKKKSKLLPIILAIVIAIVGIGGFFVYSSVQQKNKEEKVRAYLADAESFYSLVLTSGSNMESIGNAIQSAWKKYINSYYGTYYNGTYINSVDSAVEAAQDEQSSKITSVRSSDSSIASKYKSLLTVPDTNDQELLEIKDTVKDVYDAYQSMYDCVITPSGNYSSWTSEFSDVDSELGKAIRDLSDLLN